MKTKLDDLREHLFETIESLKDDKKPMDLDRARAISGVAQTIINSAKVEVDFLKVTGARAGSQFFPEKAIGGPDAPVRPQLARARD